MKMYDKNGKLTIIAKMVFDQNMERLRAGDSPLEIALTLHEQLKLVEYNGAFIDSSGAPTIWYWAAFKIGQNKWNKMKPRRAVEPVIEFVNRGVIHTSELNSYLSAYYFPNGRMPIIQDGTLVP